MYERFTDRARKVMQLANQEAQRFNHEYIGTEHILLGLVKEGQGVAANVLKNLDIDLRKIRMEVEKMVMSGPDMVTMGRIPQTPRAKKVCEYAIEEARQLSHTYVGTEHLLLGLVREHEGVAAQVLMNLGLKLEDVREEVLNLLGHNPGDRASAKPPAGKTPTLDFLGTDLTALARDRRLGPCVGRGNEIDRTLLVLGCRKDSNPLLIGPPGVGKASIVSGLARLAVGDNPPEVLRGRRLVRLSVQQTVMSSENDSRTLLRRAQTLTSEARKAGNVLFFVEDLFWYGHDSVFKAALDAGGIQCIAAVTPETYHSSIAGGVGFGRNFQPIFVEPPPPEEVIAILRAHRADYESHHAVPIADDALLASAELSERHLTEGCQPVRALRLLDQAAALFRLRHAPTPPNTAEMDGTIAQLNVQKEEAVAEQDFEKAAHLRDQADKLKKKKEQVLAEWRQKRPPIEGIVDAAVVEQAVTKLTGVQFRGSDAIRARPQGM